jgi:hypothetical protein
LRKCDTPALALQVTVLPPAPGGIDPIFPVSLPFFNANESFRINVLCSGVVRGLEIDAQRPAIHMLLQVEMAEGAYLADVGFGNLAPASALLLAPQIQQETPHELMRFIDVGGELTLQARLNHGWQHISRVNRLKRPLSRGSSPAGYPAEPLVSYQINRQSSSTSDPRLRGALPNSDLALFIRSPPRRRRGESQGEVFRLLGRPSHRPEDSVREDSLVAGVLPD